MLEIFALIALSQVNSKAAKARGHSGGGAVAYTLGLWIGLELLGAAIGGAVVGEALATYGLAIVFAIVGGGISVVISRLGTVVPLDATQPAGTGAEQPPSQLPNAMPMPMQPSGAQTSSAFVAEKTGAAPQQQAPRFCIWCGTPTVADGTFCLECGKQLVGGAAGAGAPVPTAAPVRTPVPTAAAPVPPAAVPAPTLSVTPAPAPHPQAARFAAAPAPQFAPNPTPKQGSKRLPLIIGAAAGVLALVIIGIIVAVTLMNGLTPAGDTAPVIDAGGTASNAGGDSGSTARNDSAPVDEAENTAPGGGMTGDETAGGSGTQYTLTETFDAYDNSYTILGFAIEVNASGNTIVKCEGTGFDVLPLREGFFKVPVDCLLVATDGTEHHWQGATTGPDGIEYEFDGKVDAINIIFSPADNGSKRVTVPLR